MRKLKLSRLILAGLLAAAAAAIAAGPASAKTLTVCPGHCPYNQIAPAVAAAKNGDTISIGRGTYDGGITIDVSVKLAGAGAGATIISGGGPVLTIGAFGAASEPTVSIDGVTITGGVTRSSPESIPCTGKEGVWAAGGGVEVPPSTGGACNDFGGGATVTITNSVISGNRVAPSDTVPFPPCGGCPVAYAYGGGIDTSGSLTLANTAVSDNLVGSASGLSLSGLARFAEGGGIFSGRGDMTISNSSISGNQAAVSPHGVTADAGGIAFNSDDGVGDSTFTMSNSSVMNNSATVTSDFFAFVPVGGVHLKGIPQAVTISNSTISGNAATATNSGPFDAGVVAGGLNEAGDLAPTTLSNDLISDNSVTATTLPGSTGNAVGRSGAGEMGGTLKNVRLTGNTVEVSSAAGNATALGGASVFDGGVDNGGTITNSLVADNHVHVSAPLGSVDVRGGGLNIFGPTTLSNSTVRWNTVHATGASGSAYGGGLYDGFNPDGPPGGPLVLQNSRVMFNRLSGSGVTLQGGGIFLQGQPIALTNSVITMNAPNQCFGC